MKSIIKHEATFKNNSDTEVKVTQKIHQDIRYTMKQDMLNKSTRLDKPSTEGKSPLEKSVQA